MQKNYNIYKKKMVKIKKHTYILIKINLSLQILDASLYTKGWLFFIKFYYFLNIELLFFSKYKNPFFK